MYQHISSFESQPCVSDELTVNELKCVFMDQSQHVLSSDNLSNKNKDDYILIKTIINSLKCMLRQNWLKTTILRFFLPFPNPELQNTKAIFSTAMEKH